MKFLHNSFVYKKNKDILECTLLYLGIKGNRPTLKLDDDHPEVLPLKAKIYVLGYDWPSWTGCFPSISPSGQNLP